MVALLNCRWVYTSWPAIQTALNKEKPDVAILTETKLVSRMHGMLNRIQEEMGDYQMHHSSIIHPKGKKEPTHGAAGVIILIHNKYAAELTKMEVKPALAGYLVHVTIGTKETTLTNIIGTYMPSDKPEARRAVYNYIENTAKQCNGTNHTMMVAGDWNATLYSSDRSEGNHNATDKHHAQKCADMQLRPNTGHDREHTYHCYEKSILQHSSRIDDIYILSPPHDNQCSEKCIEVGSSLDHMMLTQTIPATTLQMAIAPLAPLAPPKQAKQLQYPISKEALRLTKQAINATHTTQMEQTGAQIEEAYTTAIALLEGDHRAKQIQKVRAAMQEYSITEMADNLMVHIQRAHDTMLSICPNKKPYTGKYFPRTVGKGYTTLNETLTDMKRLRREVNNKVKNPQCTYITPPHTEKAKEMLEQYQADMEHPNAWLLKLGEAMQGIQQEMKDIRQKHDKANKEAKQKTFSTQLGNNARVMHRRVFRKTEGTTTFPTVLKDEHGQPHTHEDELTAILTDYMTKVMAPNGHQKDGQYLPKGNTEARAPQNEKGPWETTGIDQYKLETPALANRANADILSLLMDGTTFMECIRHLSKNKQPGPDGIPNELLASLPGTWHGTIHKLLVLMWITGETPACWKNSNTIMLYKKVTKCCQPITGQ